MIDDHSGFDVPNEYVALEVKRRHVYGDFDSGDLERLTALTRDLRDTYGEYDYLVVAWRERMLLAPDLSIDARTAGMYLLTAMTRDEGHVIPESRVIEFGHSVESFRSGRRELAAAGWLGFSTQGYLPGEAAYELLFPHLSPA